MQMIMRTDNTIRVITVIHGSSRRYLFHKTKVVRLEKRELSSCFKSIQHNPKQETQSEDPCDHAYKNNNREVLGIEAHSSKSLVLWGLSLSPLCLLFPQSVLPRPSLPHFPLTTACPHVPACLLCQASPVTLPGPLLVPLSPCHHP